MRAYTCRRLFLPHFPGFASSDLAFGADLVQLIVNPSDADTPGGRNMHVNAGDFIKAEIVFGCACSPPSAPLSAAACTSSHAASGAAVRSQPRQSHPNCAEHVRYEPAFFQWP